MIGSLLCYVLYPLSRYVTSRHSEASKKGLPPPVVNGKAVWDGGAVTTRRFTQSQKTLLDQRLSPGSGTKGETKERMKEPSPEKEDYKRPGTDKEQLMAVLHDETKDDAASKMSEVTSTVNEMEAETRNVQQQDKVEAPMQEVREKSIHHEVFHMKPNTEDGNILKYKTTEDSSPELALGAQLECLQTEDSTQEMDTPVQEQIQIPRVEGSVTPAEPSIQETTHLVQEQIQIPSVEESVTPAEPSIQETTHLVQEQIQIPSVEESVTPAEPSIQETTHLVQEQIQIPTLEGSVTPAVPSIQETICLLQEQIQIPRVEESVTPAEPSIQETTHLVQEQIQIPTLEGSVTPAVPSIQETICLLQEQIQIPRVEESVTPAITTNEVTECWDEYVVQTADRSGFLSNTQTHLELSGQPDPQPGWHFPAGPGLAEEVQCPLWQFPAGSYYPPIEPSVPFEVMWRVWEEMDETATTAKPLLFTKASMDFTVMSYNILADDLLEANQELYTHCPLEVLDWSYRCDLLLEEIQKWEPDILCLQEVQENHYYEQLHPVLSQMGYTCVYKRRTGTKTDGCATCYRSSCFSEVSVTTLEFFKPEMELLDRHNVGIVLLLRPVVIQGSEVKAKGLPLCVANTHLLFNPKRGDVKLAQLSIMLAEIDSVVTSCKAKGEHCNLIFCGDFNSVPHMPLYQLITTGELYFQGLPAWMISGQQDLSYKGFCHRLFAPLWPNCLGITDRCQYTTVKEIPKSPSQKAGKCQYSHDFMRQLRFCPAACVRPLDLEWIPGVTDYTPDASKGSQPYESRFRHTIEHRLDLQSVYKHILPGFGNPEVTTLHSEGGATVDYIFYTPRRNLSCDQNAGDFVSVGLKLIGSLSLLSEDVLWSMKGLPNHIFPSDHLSLLAKFQLDLNAA